jgi:hypothetical protein
MTPRWALGLNTECKGWRTRHLASMKSAKNLAPVPFWPGPFIAAVIPATRARELLSD